MNHLLLAALLAAAYPPAPPPLADKPLGPAPDIRVAYVEKDKLLLVQSKIVPVTVPRKVKVQKGDKTVDEDVAVTEYRTVRDLSRYDLSDVKAFDGAGKEVEAKTLAERLKKATPVVVSTDGEPVDKHYLELLKAETLVLVLTQPMKADKPGPVVPPPPPPGKPTAIQKNATLIIADEPKKEEPKGKEVKFDVHAGHFEKNNSGLKGDVSLLVIPDAKAFGDIFGVARTMGPKPNFVTDGTFDKQVVIATIQRGMKNVTYKVDKVTADDDMLYLAYTTTSKDSTATFHSPLIVSVDKGKYKTVVFLENGKKVGTAEFPKEK